MVAVAIVAVAVIASAVVGMAEMMYQDGSSKMGMLWYHGVGVGDGYDDHGNV